MSSSCNYYCCTNSPLPPPPPPPPPSWNLQNIWALGFHSLNFKLQMVHLPQYHMEEMVLQTCERYAPLFYMSCIDAIHHLGGTRRHQELHLCWQQLKVSCHGNRNVLFADNVILHRQDFGTVALLVCAEYKGRVDALDS